MLSIFFWSTSKAQDTSSKIVILQFELEGNYKTKDGTITRELDFQVGDSISLENLATRLEKNKTLLLNTGLFYEVELTVGEWDAANHVSILIKVREAWYIYPIPIFDLADRNFNVWWQQYNHSFKRVNYGTRLYHYNLTGRRDQLKAVIQLGYTQKYELEYNVPFINQSKTIGLNTNFLFTRNKEIALNTIDNDVSFYRDDERYLLKRYRFGVGMTYRPELYQRHKVEATYYQRNVADSVHIYNPDFFIGEKMKQQFFSLGYTYQLDKRDLKIYPLSGHFIQAEILKEGFGFFKDRNSLFVTSTFGKYFKLGKKKKFNISLLNKNRFQLIRKKPSYYNNQALGYEDDFIRGYEFYVIDGMDYSYLKSSIKYEIFNKNFNLGKAMPFKSFKIMPFRMYVTLNSDIGYVNTPFYKDGNPLSNELLFGGGIGLDLVVYIDKVIQIEYSVNRLGEKGVYLHFNLFF